MNGETGRVRLSDIVGVLVVVALVWGCSWALAEGLRQETYQDGQRWGLRDGVTVTDCELRRDLEGGTWAKGCLDSVRRRAEAR